MKGVPHSIASLPTFTGAEFFLCDEMHLIARNISKLVQDLIFEPNKFLQGELEDDYCFNLRSGVQKEALLRQTSEYMIASREFIPPTFEGNWSGANIGPLRAVDRQDILLYVIPTMVLQHLENDEAKTAIMNLVNGCTIALQWSITNVQLRKMNR